MKGILGFVLGAAVALLVASCALFSRVEPPVRDLAVCVFDDVAKGMSLSQIAADCDKDIPAIIDALLSSPDPTVKQSRAYAEALRARAVFVAHAGSQ